LVQGNANSMETALFSASTTGSKKTEVWSDGQDYCAVDRSASLNHLEQNVGSDRIKQPEMRAGRRKANLFTSRYVSTARENRSSVGSKRPSTHYTVSHHLSSATHHTDELLQHSYYDESVGYNFGLRGENCSYLLQFFKNSNYNLVYWVALSDAFSSVAVAMSLSLSLSLSVAWHERKQSDLSQGTKASVITTLAFLGPFHSGE
jgi:hypothetical protein